MKCNRHPFESGIGVCANCLRERLLALTETAAVTAPPSPDHQGGKSSSHSPSPPPLPFPRSVSPYVSRAAAAAGGGSGGTSIFSILLGRRGRGDRDKKPQHSSSSWLSALLRRRRRKKLSHPPSADDHAPAPGRDRGMSPESVCYAESPSWPRRPKPSPMRGVTAEHNHHHGGGGGLAGFAMCFSPLVPANPSRRRSRVAEIGFSGEIASPGQRHRRHASVGGPLMFPERSRWPSSDLRNLH